MTGTDVRETLHEVAGSVRAPLPDDVAFRRAVRSERRRRLRSRGVVAVGAAASVALLAWAVVPLVGTTPGPDGPADGTTVTEAHVSEPVYFTQNGRLVALDPLGVRHDLGITSEAVVGWTTERVLALDDDSHVVSYTSASTGDGPDATWTFTKAASPVTGTVTSVRLSGDGRWLAWTDLDGRLTVADLKAGTRRTEQLGQDPSIASVSATGVLLTVSGPRYVLDTADGRVDLPVPDAAYDGGSTAQGGAVSVLDRKGRTSVFQVTGSRVRRLDTVTGAGTLAPDGRSMAVVLRTGDDDRETVSVWTPEGTVRLPDVAGNGLDVRWQDETTLLVGQDQRLWACDTAAPSCGVLPTGTSGGRATIHLRP